MPRILAQVLRRQEGSALRSFRVESEIGQYDAVHLRAFQERTILKPCPSLPIRQS
jgi:hypothetical protein